MYITYPDSNEILHCQISARHYCQIDTPFYPIDNTHHCSYYLLQNNDNMFGQFCSLLEINQTMDQAVSLDYYYWAITTMRASKLHVVCLTSSYSIKLKFSIDIIHVLDACKTYTNMLFLPARSSLSKEIGSRRPENQPSNFTLDYTDVSDFTLIRNITIPPLKRMD